MTCEIAFFLFYLKPARILYIFYVNKIKARKRLKNKNLYQERTPTKSMTKGKSCIHRIINGNLNQVKIISIRNQRRKLVNRNACHFINNLVYHCQSQQHAPFSRLNHLRNITDAGSFQKND